MRRGLVAGLGSLALLVTGVNTVPLAWQAYRLHAAADDPVALADLRLPEALTPERVRTEIDAALRAEDDDLAESLVALASEHGIPVGADQQARIAALKAEAGQRAVRDFASGFVTGDTGSLPGLAGAMTGDMVGYGDLRDLVQEARKDDPDELVIGLAAVGLAVTLGTYTSVGATLPVRSGFTAVKAALKAGVVSRPLLAAVRRMTREAVDGDALRAALASARSLNREGARAAMRAAVWPGAMRHLQALAEDAGAIYAKAGQRGVQQALRLTENTDEVRRAARLVRAKGAKARAVLTRRAARRASAG